MATADTQRLVEGYVEAKSLGPILVKGLGHPVDVYEITGGGGERTRLQAAASRGLVSVTSVLASLYPIVTVVLARALLAERVARAQELGIVLTLGGVALISAG